jgi:hypothetical protein
MVKQYTKIGKRLVVWTASAILLAVVGCAFPEGRYGGDPMLGNFNRPIAATPPVWAGGDPGHTPAYDGAVHLGLPSPDVPSQSSSAGRDKIFIVPTYGGSLGLFRGTTASTEKGGETQTAGAKTASGVGARLPSDDAKGKGVFVAGTYSAPTSANGVSFRPSLGVQLASGASIEPNAPKSKMFVPVDLTKSPAHVNSIEEGRALLTTCGATFQKLEQEPTGEWRFTCAIGPADDVRRYEAKSNDQLQAMRAVMFQIQNDR